MLNRNNMNTKEDDGFETISGQIEEKIYKKKTKLKFRGGFIGRNSQLRPYSGSYNCWYFVIY